MTDVPYSFHLSIVYYLLIPICEVNVWKRYVGHWFRFLMVHYMCGVQLSLQQSDPLRVRFKSLESEIRLKEVSNNWSFVSFSGYRILGLRSIALA